jgi:tRNA threonylcarbamoyladenosine biosynthesis protein TsaB
VVSIGPGSYTGLRVGVISAKALAFATGCAAVGVPTFCAIARQADVPGTEVEVVADAQQGKLYLQAFARRSDGAPFEPTGAIRIVSGEEWAARRRALAVTGPGLGVSRSYLPPNTPLASPDCWEPDLASVLAVGWVRYQRRERDTALGLAPIYLRPSSAEEQWDRRDSGLQRPP